MTTDGAAVVRSFNDAINRRDLRALTDLMSATHRFVDSTGVTVDGRDACTDAWRGFFASLPDYRNVFDVIQDHGDGVVTVTGRSECSFAPLAGPAEWRAVVSGSRVEVWQVLDPCQDARREAVLRRREL